jgi:signal transduction histidine kinase/DNA-binding response OmpR family regulator
MVYSADNGKDAIAAAKIFTPDIILLDVMMDNMDGYDVIKVLKSTEKTKNIPVIFITSNSKDEDEEKGLSLGAIDYIAKPYTPALVKLRVKNQLIMINHMKTIEKQFEKIKTLEYENVRRILETTPSSCHLWNRDFQIFDCNKASLDLFKAESKEQFIEEFMHYSPEYQPDGSPSQEKIIELLKTVFKEGKLVVDWMHNTSTGVPIPCEISAIRVELQSAVYVVVHIKDLREQKAMMEEIDRQDNLLSTVNKVAGILLQSHIEAFLKDMYTCMGMVAKAVDVHRVYIWKNYIESDMLFCTQIYEWSEDVEPQQDTEYTVGISYQENLPELEAKLKAGDCINSMVKNLSPASQALFSPQGILSIFIAPIFIRDEFWGCIGFDDCFRERAFSENEELILRSAGLLIANSMLKNEMTLNLKSSAEQLQEALDEAQTANAAKSSFLSNMSHEIRTPMNAIIGMGELLGHEDLNQRQAGYVGDIVMSAKLLLGIINDILDFSKIESGKLELTPVDYDFEALIENIKSMFVYVAHKKGLEFRLERGENLPDYLYGDDIRLRQTLINILGNAVKFTEKGSVTLRITSVNQSLIFEIADTGVGIRKEDIPSLFSAFAQGDKFKNRSIVGTGLGLAISQSFTEMMGGNIMLESEYGQGTVFTIMIPIVAGNKDRIDNEKSVHENDNIYAPDAAVLVVDDNEFNLKVASGLLRLQGIEAVTADSGVKAIEEVSAKDYDLVFMDHMMPHMDGIETTARIRKLNNNGREYNQLPIVALTANAVFGAKEMFLANGFNDFITKPIDTGELIKVLKSWLPPDKVSEAVPATDDASVINKGAFTDELSKIKEIDVKLGLSRVSDIESMYRESIMFFNKKLVAECKKMSATLLENDIQSFAITVHAIKSALSTIGAMGLSYTAADLETAAKKGEADFCKENYPPLEKRLYNLHEQLSSIFAAESDGGNPGEREAGDAALLHERAEKAIAAADDFDGELGIELLESIIKYDFGDENNALLEDALSALNDFDCGGAIEKLKQLK